MIITDDTITMPLPDDLDWPDEMDWAATVYAQSWTLTGAMIVRTSTRQAGRPITLSGSDTSGWVPRSTCDQLAAWRDAATPLTLTIRGIPHRVLLTSLTARPLIPYDDVQPDDPYIIACDFIEIPE